MIKSGLLILGSIMGMMILFSYVVSVFNERGFEDALQVDPLTLVSDNYVEVYLLKRNTHFVSIDLVSVKWYIPIPDFNLRFEGWKFVNASKQGFWYYSKSSNVMLNQGVSRLHRIFYGNSSLGTSANSTIIGFSSVQYTPAFTNSTCGNLITTNGLNPQQGTVVHGTASGGDMQSNITRSFTATGTVTAYVSCLMYGTGASTAVAAADITDASLVSGDILSMRWIVNTIQV